MARALALVAHKDFDDKDRILSCYKGQAAYLRVFETGSICQPGYLVLYWAPGLLSFEGEAFDRGIDLQDDTWMGDGREIDPVSLQPPRPVTKPLNLVPDMKIEWKVIRCDGYLEVYPAGGDSFGLARNIISTLAISMILRKCPHESASSLDDPDQFAKYCGPYASPEVKKESPAADRPVRVVAVDGDDGLRMFAMSHSGDGHFVIRSNACLQCCLNLCREANYQAVIC